MNIIFLTMSRIVSVSERGIYTDLMHKFQKEGHNVYIVSPRERSLGLKPGLSQMNNIYILGVKTLDLQKTNVIEKGVGQVLVEGQYKRAIKRYLSSVKFDLILYSTPPISFPKVIKYIKSNNPTAKTYLLLKDIFPQNAVDLGMMSKTGLKGVLYRFFRKKEKKLYGLSDYIGCMSPANVNYLLDHNPEISVERVEVAPNSFELENTDSKTIADKDAVRKKYKLPTEKPIFIYGGNLGKPQGISFLIECLIANANRDDCHFLVIGTGTELPRLKAWYEEKKPQSVSVMNGLPKADYDQLVKACDVGLIFLDHRFTIPNYPSRLLSYLENKMPVLCATDPNTDIGRIAEENGYGYWCESNSVEAFANRVDMILNSNIKEMGRRGYEFLCKNYSIENTYNMIMSHIS